MKFLIWVQDSAYATWLRESDWALFALLIVHTIGMAFLVGVAIAIALRIIGFASQVPLAQFARLIPVAMYGLVAAVVSGVLLVVSYPAKALTNQLFYFKLSLLTVALLLLRWLLKRLLSESLMRSGSAPLWAKWSAALCLFLWACGITAGKFLAYTNKMLLVYQ